MEDICLCMQLGAEREDGNGNCDGDGFGDSDRSNRSPQSCRLAMSMAAPKIPQI